MHLGALSLASLFGYDEASSPCFVQVLSRGGCYIVRIVSDCVISYLLHSNIQMEHGAML